MKNYIQNIKNFLIENWFRVLVIVLLILVICRLNQIEKNTYYAGEAAGVSADMIIESIDRLKAVN